MTAEELINKKYPDFDELDRGNIWVNIEELMIIFAKLHVEKALKQACKVDFNNVGYEDIANDYEEARDLAIINSYSLENIK